MDFTQFVKNSSSVFENSPLIKKDSLPLTVMILSPHPDDECIVGSLALRLLHENNSHIVNVAVTLGSKVERQKERLKELENACEFLEMELVTLDENWKQKEKELKSLIQKYQPHLILVPHLKDHHPTHIKTGALLKKCLMSLKKFSTVVAWTEFWGTIAKPNVLVEVPNEILEIQMKALSMHVGEVTRNPYHLRLPAWMIDNVRRGSEIIAGAGTESPHMPFGVIYKLQGFKKGKFTSVKLPTPYLTHLADLAEIIKSLN